MTLPAMTQPLADVLSRLDRVRPQGNGRGWMASCPGPNHARGDRNPSLSIAVGDDNCVLLRCFAEARCTADSIVAALGLTTADLFEQRNGASPRPVPPRRPAPAPSSNDTAAKIEEPERKETGRISYPLPDPVTGASIRPESFRARSRRSA